MTQIHLGVDPQAWLSGASFSDCHRYRYHLWRNRPLGHGRCVFIGVNPSTATATIDDQTIRKCKEFTSRWGFAQYDMLNLFGWRSTDIKGLAGLEDHSVPSVFFAERPRRHSEKPNAFYRIVEQLTPSARHVELFARTRRPGWTQYGNELPGGKASPAMERFR